MKEIPHDQPNPRRGPSSSFLTALGLALVLWLAVIGYGIDPEISFSILCLLPISLVAWYGHKWGAVLVSTAAVAAWFWVDVQGRPGDSPASVPYWNAAIRLGVFWSVVLLLLTIRRLKKRLERALRTESALLHQETSERARAAQAAIESEERFRQMAENIKEVFWMTDAGKHQMLYVSPGYETIWGRTCESLHAEPLGWLDAVHPADRQRVSEAARSEQATGGYDESFRIVRPDGSVRWIRDRAFPVRNEAGIVYRIVGIAEDVTERKQTEKRNAVFAGLAHRLNAATTPEGAAQIILDIAAELFGWDAGYVDLYSAAEDRIIPVLTFDIVNGQRTEVSPSSFSLTPSPLMREVMREGSRLINRESSSKESVGVAPFGDTSRLSASLMFVPIRSQATVVGILSIQSYTPGAYAGDDLILLQALADHCGDALQRIHVAGALRESEELFRTVFESSPLGMALYEAGGRHLRTNRAYQRMLGYREGELETLQVGPLTCPEDLPEGERYHQELLAGKRDHYFWEHRFQRKDGCLVWAKSGAYAVRDPRGQLRFVVSIVEDVTDRHAAEGRIRQLASIVDSAHDAIIGMNLDGTIVSWNRAAELLYGYALKEILGKPISMLGLPGQADDPLHMIGGFGSEGGIEAVHRRKNGDPVEVSLAVSPISDGSGKTCGVSVIARDRTESKRLEREVLEISGTERRKIGHDLHDGVGQHLTGTAFKAKLLEQILSEEAPQYAHSAGELVGLINAGIDQVRRLARGLDPIEVEADGLESALSQLAENTRTIFRISCSLHCLEPLPRFDPTVSLQLYRIAQESIHNAVKHGRAKRIEIDLGFSDSRIRLVIADDGGGFNSEASTRSGMGLRIMEYRIHAIGGSLMIDSQVNQGTRITCLVPVFRPPSQKLDSVPSLASHPLVGPTHRQD